MKKYFIALFFVILFLSGCAAIKNANSSMQPVQRPTYMMNGPAKIQYYQEQIDHYNFLIEQEKLKMAEKK
jgi:uncharacterized protein YceK